MEKILAIGRNVELLRSRALLLEKTGISAAFCTAFDFPAHWADRGIGLVVLCHTLAPDERHLILEKVRQRWPAARILQVSRNYGDDVTEGCGDDWVSGWEPEKLLLQAMELLGRSNSQASNGVAPRNIQTAPGSIAMTHQNIGFKEKPIFVIHCCSVCGRIHECPCQRPGGRLCCGNDDGEMNCCLGCPCKC